MLKKHVESMNGHPFIVNVKVWNPLYGDQDIITLQLNKMNNKYIQFIVGNRERGIKEEDIIQFLILLEKNGLYICSSLDEISQSYSIEGFFDYIVKGNLCKIPYSFSKKKMCKYPILLMNPEYNYNAWASYIVDCLESNMKHISIYISSFYWSECRHTPSPLSPQFQSIYTPFSNQLDITQIPFSNSKWSDFQLPPQYDNPFSQPIYNDFKIITPISHPVKSVPHSMKSVPHSMKSVPHSMKSVPQYKREDMYLERPKKDEKRKRERSISIERDEKKRKEDIVEEKKIEVKKEEKEDDDLSVLIEKGTTELKDAYKYVLSEMEQMRIVVLDLLSNQEMLKKVDLEAPDTPSVMKKNLEKMNDEIRILLKQNHTITNMKEQSLDYMFYIQKQQNKVYEAMCQFEEKKKSQEELLRRYEEWKEKRDMSLKEITVTFFEKMDSIFRNK
jgi:hypothetical protein